MIDAAYDRLDLIPSGKPWMHEIKHQRAAWSPDQTAFTAQRPAATPSSLIFEGKLTV